MAVCAYDDAEAYGTRASRHSAATAASNVPPQSMALNTTVARASSGSTTSPHCAMASATTGVTVVRTAAWLRRSVSAAASAFGRPTSPGPNSSCRFRLVASTVSQSSSMISRTPSRPRHMATLHPMPPTPSTSATWLAITASSHPSTAACRTNARLASVGAAAGAAGAAAGAAAAAAAASVAGEAMDTGVVMQ